MSESEYQRAYLLYRCMQKSRFDIESLLQSDYKAIMLHSNSTIITGNQAAAEFTGYPVEELTGLNAWTLFPPESVATIMEKLVEQSEEPYTVLAKPRHGNNVPIEIQGINMNFREEPVRAVLFKPV